MLSRMTTAGLGKEARPFHTAIRRRIGRKVRRHIRLRRKVELPGEQLEVLCMRNRAGPVAAGAVALEAARLPPTRSNSCCYLSLSHGRSPCLTKGLVFVFSIKIT